MKFAFYIAGIVMIFCLMLQCKSSEQVSVFGPVQHPDDNPTSLEKVEFGRKLFFDQRLSIDNTVACGTCHVPRLAFTDGKVVAEGVEGRKSQRNTPSILNAGYLKTVMFDAHLPSLEMQAIVPIQEHVEMDMDMNRLIQKLRAIPEYQNGAKAIFGRDEFDAWVLTRSLSAFQRSLISDNSRFDRYEYFGEEDALSDSEKAGWKIFSEELYCTKCHPAPYFTSFEAENNGIYVDYGEDKGRFRIHHDSLDIGKFKVPSLRNIELTSPYMHDGSMASLEEVIEHYAQGGRGHVQQHSSIKEFDLSKTKKKDLINFLKSLTDTTYMINFR